MKLTEKQREICFDCDDGSHLLLRVLQPSVEHGAWTGNRLRLRKWTKCDVGEAVYRNCTDWEVREFEEALGEVSSGYWYNHIAIGRCYVAQKYCDGKEPND